MLLTTHVAIGAALGLLTKNPFLAFGAGLISHHLVDKIPHYDIGSNYVGGKEPAEISSFKYWEKIIIVIDFLVSLGLLIWLLKISINQSPEVYVGDLWTKENTLIVWGIFGAILPDLFYNLSKMVKNKFSWLIAGVPFRYYHQFHEKFHYTVHWKYWYLGLLSQIVLIGLSLWYILK